MISKTYLTSTDCTSCMPCVHFDMSEVDNLGILLHRPDSPCQPKFSPLADRHVSGRAHVSDDKAAMADPTEATLCSKQHSLSASFLSYTFEFYPQRHSSESFGFDPPPFLPRSSRLSLQMIHVFNLHLHTHLLLFLVFHPHTLPRLPDGRAVAIAASG